MKQRFKEARRSAPLYPAGIPPEKVKILKDMIQAGTSKKMICLVLGINYKELKRVIENDSRSIH